MQLTISSKGQLVLPAPVRRRLRLKARSKVELEEREGGVFIKPVVKRGSVEPIDYPAPGALKVTKRMLEQDKLFGEESL
jgi:AbrB family looped-hinge helix DNA binding protein